MAEQIQKTDYQVQSLVTGKVAEDSGWLLDMPGESTPGLLRTVYRKKQLHLKEDQYGIYKYADWLPVRGSLKGSAAPVTYRSKGLAEHLDLENLYVTFSGYWPERGAFMKTCSFKETEAYSVCARLDPSGGKILVVASAGNTARSFARVCSDNNIPLLLCLPLDNIESLWFDHPLNDCVRLIVTPAGSDYFDAIHLSGLACQSGNFIAEGGAKNIARRDGMGTTVLSAVTTIGRIPDFYFQAVGSGTGAIAAWEANLRLIGDGRYGSNKMKLIVSQNIPFSPIYKAWKQGSRQILPMDDEIARQEIRTILAKVLSNRKPPYGIAGGLFDALTDTGGDVMVAANAEVMHARSLFEELEGIDIHPAAAVATATLIQAAAEGRVGRKDIVMLNITGGGEEKMKHEKKLFYLKPSLEFGLDVAPCDVAVKVRELFSAALVE